MARPTMKIRFAVTPPAAALAGDAFADYLAHCEHLGFDTLWLSDIPLGPGGDPLVSLACAAGCTRRLKLGANLVPLGRNPWWLAKQLAQLDQLSGGRLLLSFVPGLGSPPERAALGYTRGDRGRAIETVMDLCRRWWAGEAVTAEFEGARFDGVTLDLRPRQAPLEVWLGGKGPLALARVARAGDGWLTAAVTPAEATAGRRSIEQQAVACGRAVDPEHFGISIPVSRDTPPPAALAALKARRDDGDLSQVVATGREALRALVRAHLDGGLSKFVLRPLNALERRADWRTDLEWMADSVLDLQR
ncbi:MAG: LLM class flavin-dependent oxidoreductase [Gammaproteobacteria bacterium]|nr:LLM class flavin-dependent oxidoreductase [Gammaproteobacteria bacterium]